MTGAPGFLEFFILEASEYVEQLDALLLGGNATGPDAESVQRTARALRGTATMARLPAFAELAGAVERVGRAMQEGALAWNPAIGGALTAAIDDLKTLLRSVRGWSPADEQRATTRSAELQRYAPARVARPAPDRNSPTPSGTPAPFLATEAANIAAGVELMTTRAGDPDTVGNVLQRVRALRGVAGVKEIVPLSDVLEAIEESSRGLETGHEALTAEGRQLLEAAAGYLRELAIALRSGSDLNASSATRDTFITAHTVWSLRDSEHDTVVPITSLFYADDQSGIVEASPHPPTSLSERLRLEMVSLSEHLRQVLDAARTAEDAAALSRVRRDLRRALRAMQLAAESFGELELAHLIERQSASADPTDRGSLATLAALATVASEAPEPGVSLESRLRHVIAGTAAKPAATTRPAAPAAPAAVPPAPAAPAAVAAPTAPPRPAAPAPAPAAPRPLAAAAADHLPAIGSLIDSSLAALESFTAQPFARPTPIPETTVVPIESLLYRGRAALDRAIEVSDVLRRAAPGSDAAALAELFDLLELARAD